MGVRLRGRYGPTYTAVRGCDPNYGMRGGALVVFGDRRLQWAAGDTRGDSRDLDYFFLAAITPVGIGGSGSRRRIRYDSFEEGERRMWPHDRRRHADVWALDPGFPTR